MIHTKEYNSILLGLIEIEYYKKLVVSEQYIRTNEYNSILLGLIEIEYYIELVVSE